MILIDIDVRFKKIDITPTGVVFDLRDANNPDTVLILQFYQAAVDYLKKEFIHADIKKVREEMRLEFVQREQVALKGLREELDTCRIECAILLAELEI